MLNRRLAAITLEPFGQGAGDLCAIECQGDARRKFRHSEVQIN